MDQALEAPLSCDSGGSAMWFTSCLPLVCLSICLSNFCLAALSVHANITLPFCFSIT